MLKTEYAHKRRYLNPFGGESNAVFLCPQERRCSRNVFHKGQAAGFGFHHASEDGKYLIMGNGTQAYAIAAEQPQRDNPLKHVEDTIEQNDNNFDGLINNTPQTPTVADFEQRAKAGEAISVTDLAKAVKAEKREQPQKKPSILKKLDEYKKQAAQQPKDKQKEHKKDLEV